MFNSIPRKIVSAGNPCSCHLAINLHLFPSWQRSLTFIPLFRTIIDMKASLLAKFKLLNSVFIDFNSFCFCTLHQFSYFLANVYFHQLCFKNSVHLFDLVDEIFLHVNRLYCRLPGLKISSLSLLLS